MKKFLLLLTCAGVLFGCGGKKDDGGGKTTPPGALFKEPITAFGASKSTVKNQETLSLDYENETALGYSSSNYKVVYLFENNKLTGSAVVLSLDTDAKKLVDFLSSRYDIVGQDGEYFIWESKDGSMSVVVKVETLGIFVMFLPNGSSYASIALTPLLKSSEQADEDAVKDVVNAIRNQFK